MVPERLQRGAAPHAPNLSLASSRAGVDGAPPRVRRPHQFERHPVALFAAAGRPEAGIA